jgi:hypothetical protein
MVLKRSNTYVDSNMPTKSEPNSDVFQAFYKVKLFGEKKKTDKPVY